MVYLSITVLFDTNQPMAEYYSDFTYQSNGVWEPMYRYLLIKQSQIGIGQNAKNDVLRTRVRATPQLTLLTVRYFIDKGNKAFE